MAGTSPAMTPKGVATRPFSRQSFIFNFQRAKRHHPYSLARPRVGPSPFLLFSPAQMRGGWRARWRDHCSFSARVPSRKHGAPPGAPPRQACAVWAHLRRLPCCAGPRFSLTVLLSRLPSPCCRYRRLLTKPRDSRRPSVSQLLAGGSYWPPGGAPAPPGCVLCEARPRAPHPAPPSDASR